MGIYIKNMKMPKDIEPGLVIEFADGINGKRYARLWHYRHGGLTEWLEAVPVPPHGRTIDADVLLKKCEFVCTDDDVDVRAVRYSIIDAAPTIIPAEEDE